MAIALFCLPAIRTVSAAPQTIPLELGFGPSTLTTVSNGIPVYTNGDSIWVSSEYNQTVSVSLLSPGSQTVLTRTLEPRDILPLYSFSVASPDGLWTLQITAAGGTATIPVNFVSAEAHQAAIDPAGYSLSGDNLSVAARVVTRDGYDMEVCGFGNESRATVSFRLPGFAGSGTVNLHISNSTLSMTTNGSVNSPFAFWFELYHPYSFDVMGTSTFLLRNLRVAASQPLLVDSAGSENGTLEWGVTPRHGRFQVMAFFQGPHDVYASQARLLMADDGSWLPLDTCGVQSVQSESVTYQTSLAGGPSSWPRRIYLMYRSLGVEFVSSAALMANVSSVSFVSPPWPDGLKGATMDVAPNQKIQQMSQQSGSLYLLARQYPVSVNYSVSVEGIKAASGTLLVSGPYSSLEIEVNLARLDASVVSDENTTFGLQVVVKGGTLMQQVSTNESATFFLPGGPATVTASRGGNSQDVRMVLTDNLGTVVVFNYATGRLPELVLAIAAIVGAVANLVWLLGPKKWLRR